MITQLMSLQPPTRESGAEVTWLHTSMWNNRWFQRSKYFCWPSISIYFPSPWGTVAWRHHTFTPAWASPWDWQKVMPVGSQTSPSLLGFTGDWRQVGLDIWREKGWVEKFVLFVKFSLGFPCNCYQRKVLAYELFNINSGIEAGLLTVWLLQRFL